MKIYLGSLGHPWIKEDGEAPDTPLDNAVLSRLKQFKAMNNFKKVALRVCNNDLLTNLLQRVCIKILMKYFAGYCWLSI